MLNSKHRGASLSFALHILLVFSVFSCTPGSSSNTLANRVSWFGIDAILERESYYDSVFCADMRGSGAEEIVIVRGSRATMYRLDGSEIVSVLLPGGPYGRGTIADLDGDGKMELLLGSNNSGMGSVVAINGFGNVIFHYDLFEQVRGWIEPRVASGGNILFLSGSLYNISPKTVGVLQATDGKILWRRDFGPVLRGMDVDKKGEKITLSMSAGTRDRRGMEDFDAESRRQPQLLQLSSAGEELLRVPYGEPLVEGLTGMNSYAGIDSIFIDSESGTNTALLLQAYSEFYDLPPGIVMLDSKGRELFRRRGPDNSYGTMIAAAGRLYAAWAEAGLVEGIGETGEVTALFRSEGEVHDMRVLSSRSLSDGTLILAADRNTLFLLTEDLELLWHRTFSGTVSGAGIFAEDNGDLLLLVEAEHYYLLRTAAGGKDEPQEDLPSPVPTASAFPARTENRNIMDPASLPSVPESLISRKPELQYSVSAPESYLMLTGPFLPPGPSPQIYLFDAADGTSSFLNKKLEVILTLAPADPDNYRQRELFDYDGDGFLDILTTTPDPLRIHIDSADGRPLFSRTLLPVYDGYSGILAADRELLYITLSTGYMEYPRGVIALERLKGRIRYFYPTALRSATRYHSPIHEGLLFYNTATVSNGAELVRSNGEVERDTEFYLHIINGKGEEIPPSGPMKDAEHTGERIYFGFLDGGTERIGYVEGKFKGYYEGTPEIGLWDPANMRFDITALGPENSLSGSIIVCTLAGGQTRVFIPWNNATHVDVLDGHLRPAGKIIVPDGLPGMALNAVIPFDEKSDAALVFRGRGEIVITDLNGSVINRIDLKTDNPLYYSRAVDFDGDGIPELLAAMKSELRIYSFTGKPF